MKKQAETSVKLHVDFAGFESGFVNEPCGLLGLSQTRLEGVVMANNKQLEPRIVVSLGA